MKGWRGGMDRWIDRCIDLKALHCSNTFYASSTMIGDQQDQPVRLAKGLDHPVAGRKSW
jgi:hypothetical protein